MSPSIMRLSRSSSSVGTEKRHEKNQGIANVLSWHLLGLGKRLVSTTKGLELGCYLLPSTLQRRVPP